MITTFEALRRVARRGPPVTVGLMGPDSTSAARALAMAEAEGMSAAIPFDDPAAAVAAAREGHVGVLLKGSLRTDQLLRVVLDRDAGLRTGSLLSDVLLYADTLTAGSPRLVGVTDGGINPAPDAAALRAIVTNAVAVFRALGFDRPRVALLSATEAVSDAVASTVVARDVARWAATSLGRPLPHPDPVPRGEPGGRAPLHRPGRCHGAPPRRTAVTRVLALNPGARGRHRPRRRPPFDALRRGPVLAPLDARLDAVAALLADHGTDTARLDATV